MPLRELANAPTFESGAVVSEKGSAQFPDGHPNPLTVLEFQQHRLIFVFLPLIVHFFAFEPESQAIENQFFVRHDIGTPGSTVSSKRRSVSSSASFGFQSKASQN